MRAATWTGGCHCGAVRFRVRRRGALTAKKPRVLACNCLVCVKKGNLHLLVPKGDFTIVSGRDRLATYTFGARVAEHYFCTDCGMHPFYQPKSPPDPTMWDVNARCLDDFEENAFTIEPLDGKAMDKEAIRALKEVLPKRGTSLERKYITLCEAGIYGVDAQTKRLGITKRQLDNVVRRLRETLRVGSPKVGVPD